MTRLSIVTVLIYLVFNMQNARLDESKARINISRKNTNNFRYADDITLMAKHEEELKSFLMRVTEQSEKSGLKLNLIYDHGISSHHFMANRSGKSGSRDKFYILGLHNHCGW